MARGQSPKVYRLQGIPNSLVDAQAVVDYLRKTRPDLADYDVEVFSLAEAFARSPQRVATVMFTAQDTVNVDPARNSASSDPLCDAISRGKDGLALDDNFLGLTPLNDVPADDYEFE